MDASRRRLLQGVGIAALAIGGLTAGACIHPPEPVHEIIVRRSPEPARTSDRLFSAPAVVYRLGVHTADLPRIRDSKGEVTFRVFRCADREREDAVPTTVEPAAPGDPITWVRIAVPRRYVQSEARHCGYFWGRHGFMVMGGDQPASAAFRFEGHTAE